MKSAERTGVLWANIIDSSCSNQLTQRVVLRLLLMYHHQEYEHLYRARCHYCHCTHSEAELIHRHTKWYGRVS